MAKRPSPMKGGAATADPEDTGTFASLQKLRELSANMRATMPELQEGGDKPKGKGKGLPAAKGAKPRQTGLPFSPPVATGDKQAGGPLVDGGDAPVQYSDIQAKYEMLMSDYESLMADAKKRQESYVRREVQFKSQIERMKELLEKAVLNRGGSEVGMPRIRQLHTKIQDSLADMKNRTQRIIEEHEKDMLRQFRVRLFDVEEKLKKEHTKKDDTSGLSQDWAEKTQKLSKDLDKYREEAVRLDRLNELLLKENNRLKSTTKTQEDDREFLLRQMVGLKKENGRLRKELEKAATSSMRVFLSPEKSNKAGGTPGPSSNNGAQHSVSWGAPTTLDDESHARSGSKSGGLSLARPAEAEVKRLNEVIKRLRRLLDSERKSLREVRSSHVHSLASRTELESLLRDAVDEVRAEVALRRAEALKPGGEDEPSALSREGRERVLELMLSKERVLTLLYDKTFPPRSSLSTFGGSAALTAMDDPVRAGGQSILDYMPELHDGPDDETWGDDEDDEAWDEALSAKFERSIGAGAGAEKPDGEPQETTTD
eukprot:CAMPEP_0114548816 /NCGR_PEP_ID=MMETSP0114-20121206/5189_1 /TAXON_ID=31324 /ORGANISM="Goniomonas sp, Strain m" /LENGTH=541 /DNA_ID=CAMNT_0001733443 /DNA_START=31 /DNA_END=1656 /DNA_ORIENTATION=-